MSWVEIRSKTEQSLKFALFDANQWSEPKPVVTVPVIWDLPKVIGLKGGAFGAVWGVKNTSPVMPYTSDIYVSRSGDGGGTWSTPVLANTDREVKVPRYSAHIAALPAGEMAILWSDARHITYAPPAPGREQGDYKGQQALMGAVMDTNGRVGKDFVVDEDICSCCQLVPVQFKDKLFLTYWDHLPGEVRDIAVIAWPGITQAKPVGWGATICRIYFRDHSDTLKKL